MKLKLICYCEKLRLSKTKWRLCSSTSKYFRMCHVVFSNVSVTIENNNSVSTQHKCIWFLRGYSFGLVASVPKQITCNFPVISLCIEAWWWLSTKSKHVARKETKYISVVFWLCYYIQLWFWAPTEMCQIKKNLYIFCVIPTRAADIFLCVSLKEAPCISSFHVVSEYLSSVYRRQTLSGLKQLRDLGTNRPETKLGDLNK
jgi:hypothetical protein